MRFGSSNMRPVETRTPVSLVRPASETFGESTKFSESPTGVRQEGGRHRDGLAERACTNDVMDYNSFLGAVRIGLSRGTLSDGVQRLLEEIKGILRENAAQTRSPEEGGTSTADGPAPSLGLAPRVSFGTRLGTRANPNNEGTESASVRMRRSSQWAAATTG